MLLARCQVRFQADDGLDAVLLGSIPKVERAEEIPVVRDRDGFLAESICLGEQFIKFCGSVEHGIFGVRVKVYETIAFPCRTTGQECVDLQLSD